MNRTESAKTIFGLILIWKVDRPVREPVDDVLANLFRQDEFDALTLGNSDQGMTFFDRRWRLLKTGNFETFFFALHFAAHFGQNNWSAQTLSEKNDQFLY